MSQYIKHSSLDTIFDKLHIGVEKGLDERSSFAPVAGRTMHALGSPSNGQNALFAPVSPKSSKYVPLPADAKTVLI